MRRSATGRAGGPASRPPAVVVPQRRPAARREPPVAPADADARDDLGRRAGPRRGDADRPAARRGRRRAGGGRGRRRRRRVDATPRRRSPRRPAPGRRRVAAAGGWAGKTWALQQGLDAATGDVGRVPRRRHPPDARAAARARRPVRRRRPRPADRRRPLRLPDAWSALAAPGAADDARLPHGAAGRARPGPGAPARRQRPVHGGPGGDAARGRRVRRRRRPHASRTSPSCGRWPRAGFAGRLPRRRATC